MAEDTVDVVLLAYNEVDTIEAEIRDWRRYVVDLIPGSRILVAEDGSTDGTTQLLRRLEHEGVLVHEYTTSRRGYKGAFMDAFRRAEAPYIFFADTGGKMDVREFWGLWPFRHDYDLIVGRKVLRTDPIPRRLLTRGYNVAIRLYFSTQRIHDADAGFRLFSKPAADWVIQQDLLFKDLVNSEIVVRTVAAGWRFLERPVLYEGRAGKSRGLPTKEIPGKVLGVLKTFPAVKADINKKRELS